MKDFINKLADNLELTGDEAYQALSTIMSGDATDAQIAAYLTALRLRGESADVIAGSVRAMREKFTSVATPDDVIIDTCGTGGDGMHTFNISTAVAIVAAAAGVTVAKHGNRGVSSKSGSADVLTALGVDISVSPDVMERCLKDIGIAFLFAPSLHPAMKHAIGPRREIGIRTLFNILGPMSNPASANHGVLGVYDGNLVPLLAEASHQLGAQHMFIVHGNDGLDEITTTTTTRIAEVTPNGVKEFELDPQTLGIALARAEDLVGGEPDENAGIIRSIFEGETGPKTDIVLVNAAAAIVAGQKAENLKDGLELATATVSSGKAQEKLAELVKATH